MRNNKVISDDRLKELMTRETGVFQERTPISAKIYLDAKGSMFNGVPMPWMSEWNTPHPIFISHAQGAHITDVDGNLYRDFCLGDTGAMFGHSPEPTAQAVSEQIRRGVTTMLPSEDAAWVGRELARRFGLPYWQIAMTATDANRFVMRICRALTKRPKVLVYNHCYHGSLDESLVVLEDGQLTLMSEYDMHPGISPNAIVRVVEFNDVEGLERALAHEDVACVLAEPVMTNCGMVLPQEGYHETLRELTRKHGTYLIIDETHTLSTGPGGYTAAYNLDPDFLTVGKSIAGGIPVAAYGFTAEVGEVINATFGQKPVSALMGIGGTLSGNAFAINATRATLEHVATEAAYETMIAGANRMADGLEASIHRNELPWSVARCGARAELQFVPQAPKSGAESKQFLYWDLIAYTHLYLANRGILVTPFHNMMLVSPVTTDDDIDELVNQWDRCMTEISEEA